ncbi:hypothetical protein M8J75_002645 [Diaphorina citri]|nr:hypothetical protein M8J75_002645 [Diaphorina citri]
MKIVEFNLKPRTRFDLEKNALILIKLKQNHLKTEGVNAHAQSHRYLNNTEDRVNTNAHAIQEGAMCASSSQAISKDDSGDRDKSKCTNISYNGYSDEFLDTIESENKNLSDYGKYIITLSTVEPRLLGAL